jgi:DNA-binding Lrp family transcriptional regulator
MSADPKIDGIDATIIKMLMAESRTSFTDIAKVCKITVGAVRMRYKRLWKDGIITGEVTLVNPRCLGYRHIVDLGIITDFENEKEVAAFLETKPQVSQVIKHMGKYNFFAKAALREINSVLDIIEDLESCEKIKHVDALIWADAVNVEFASNLTIKPLPLKSDAKKLPSPKTDVDPSMLDFDEIDRQIAIIVAKKSRTPFRQIGEQIGISTKTVIQRYKKLRKSLLPTSTIRLNLSKLGYKALAHFYINVSNRSKMTEIYSQLLKIPNLIVIIRLLGHFDLYVCVALEDFDKMFEVTQQINRINNLEPDVLLGPSPPAWPLDLFSSLLETGAMPKYWEPEPAKNS